MATNNTTKSNNIIRQNVLKHPLASKYINDDWGTIAFLIPRNSIHKDFIEEAFYYSCIYFLIGNKDGKELAYVGQTDKHNNPNKTAMLRIIDHDKNIYEKYYENWDSIVIVTNKSDTWDAADLKALEHAFYHEIPVDKRLNSIEPNSGRPDYSKYQDKINQIKAYISAIGYEIFNDESLINNIGIINQKDEPKVTDTVDKGIKDIHSGKNRIPEYITPKKVVKQMLDMLPDTVWNEKTKFFDPACKGGEYLREIHDRLMDCARLKSLFPDEKERTIHILKNQLYGISLSQISHEMVTRKLFGFNYNISYHPKLIAILKRLNKNNPDYKKNLYKRLIKQLFVDIEHKEDQGDNEEMQFDVVIGNPPYQENNGGGKSGMSAKSLYDKFIDMALEVSDNVCMIVKDNWMNYKGMEEIRKKMLGVGLVEVIDYPINNVTKEVFSNVSVSVNIFHTSKGYSGKTHFTEIKNGKVTSEYREDIRSYPHIPTSLHEMSIINKLKESVTDNYSTRVSSAYPFGITSNGNYSSGGEEVDLSIEKTNEYNIPILFLGGAPFYRYIKLEDIVKGIDRINDYKLISKLQLRKIPEVITGIQALGPGSICSGSYGVLFSTTNKDELKPAYKYLKTKFVRAIVYWGIDSKSTVAPYRFELVPNQDFTSNSDIDWSQSITNIDQQLYKKYNLTPEEINYIESTIKSLDTEPKLTEEKVSFTMHDVAANFINQQIKSQDTP